MESPPQRGRRWRIVFLTGILVILSGVILLACRDRIYADALASNDSATVVAMLRLGANANASRCTNYGQPAFLAFLDFLPSPLRPSVCIAHQPFLVKAAGLGPPDGAVIVRELLARGVDVNASGQYGYGALNAAVEAGDAETVRLLLEKGASPEDPGSLYEEAVHTWNNEVIGLLLEHGLLSDFPDGETFLHYAARNGAANVVTYLLARGISPDVASTSGQTPLMVATDTNQIQIVDILLRHGAHLEKVDAAHYTAVDHALREGHMVVFKEFLKRGLSPGRSVNGLTPASFVRRWYHSAPAPVKQVWYGAVGLTP